MATSTSYAQDNSPTSAVDGTYLVSNDLTLTSYTDLDVPSGATINGITLSWLGGSNGQWSGEDKMMSVSNNKGSSFSGKLATDSNVSNSPTLRPAVYGGATNLWGLTWTVNQANTISTNFFYDSGGAAKRVDPKTDMTHFTLLYIIPLEVN